MNTTLHFAATILLCAICTGAETVSLKGTVKKTGGTAGIAGVKLSLTKSPALSATTGTDGAFTLSGTTTSVKARSESVDPIRFMIRGNAIVFAPASNRLPVIVTLFGSDGKVRSTSRLRDLSSVQQSATLPKLGTGISIMRITMGQETFTCTLMRVGNNLMSRSEVSGEKTAGRLILAKQLASPAVDTLKAEKNGYMTVKTPIESYSRQDIAIQMDTSAQLPGGKCSRDAMQELANGFIAAMEAGDPTKMSLGPNVKYFEQFKATDMGKGIWTAKIKANLHREFIDVDSCKMFVEILDNVSSTPRNIGSQIKVSDGKISEINTLVADKDDWNLSAADAFTFVYDKSKAEAWTVIPAEKQNDRKTIQAPGDLYLDMFNDQSVKVPWGDPCNRLEGKMYVICNSGIPSGSLKMLDRQYVIDVDLGTVDIFCKFAGNIPDSHMFRVEGGKIRFVHTLTATGKN